MAEATEKKYMTAAQAYGKAISVVEMYAGQLGTSTAKELRRLADDMDVLADVFARRPETWTSGVFYDDYDRKVCSVGMLYPAFRNKAKLQGLKLKKVTRRSEVSGSPYDGLNSFLIEINDSTLCPRQGAILWMGPQNVVRVYKILAPAVRKLADLRAESHRPLKTEVVEATLCGPLKVAHKKATWYRTNKIGAR